MALSIESKFRWVLMNCESREACKSIRVLFVFPVFRFLRQATKYAYNWFRSIVSSIITLYSVVLLCSHIRAYICVVVEQYLLMFKHIFCQFVCNHKNATVSFHFTNGYRKKYVQNYEYYSRFPKIESSKRK